MLNINCQVSLGTLNKSLIKLAYMTKPKTKETLGERLKRCRDEAGLTQDQLGAAAGVTASAIAQIEADVSKTIRSENLFPIARKLNKNAEWLLTGEGHETDYGPLVDSIIDLPDDNPQQSLDFISYRWERSEGIVASDKIAKYTTVIDKMKRDLDKRRGDK